MRRKTLFSMCAFAAVLAGCSNEELINVQPEASLTDRAKVNFVLSSNAGGYKLGDTEADTRTIWKDGNYYWDSTTKLGACIVDGAVADQPAYDGIVTNHPFVPVEAITTPVQTADFKTDTEVREGVYLFYHQYDSKAIQDRKLYCEFPTTQIMEDASKPYDHLTKQNFFISPLIKITDGIEDGATNEIPVQFVSMFSGFAPTFVNESGKDIEISKVEVVGGTNAFKVGGYINTVAAAGQFDGVVITGDYETSEELAAAIKEKKEGLQNGTRDLYNATGLEQASSVSINLPNIKVAAGASQEIRMLFPAGVYNKNTLTVKVYATDGTVCSVALNPSTGNTITFNRNVFGTKEMELENFEKITAIDIYSIEDWRYALTVKRENEVIPFKLMNDIEIESTEDIPSFALKVISNASEKLILKGENTYEFNDQSVIANLQINEGATLNYKGGEITTSLTNQKGATLNIQKDVTVGASNTIATLTNNGTMTIAKDVTLDNKASGFTNTGAKAVLNNNGTLLLSDAWTNNATLNNSGIIAIADSKTLTNSANCTINMNDGYFWYVGSAAANKITNNGTIVLANAKDVFMFGATTPAADDTKMTTGSGKVSLVAKSTDNVDLTKIAEVTAITLTGDGWNKDSIKKAKGSMTALTFKDATADLKGCDDYSTVDFTLEGTTVLNNSATAAEEVKVKSLTAAKDAKVTLNGAKQTLSVAEDITVAAGATMTNNTAIAMVDNKEVTVNGTLNNAGAINVPGATDAEKSITVEVANKGSLNNTGELACGNYNTSAINVSGKANFTGGKAYGVLTLTGSAATTGDVIAEVAPTAVVATDATITELITAGCKEIYVGVTTTETTITGADVTVYLLENANVTLATGANTVGRIVIADAGAVLKGTSSSSTLTVNSFIVAVDSWTIGNDISALTVESIDAKCNFAQGVTALTGNIKNAANTEWEFDTLTNRWKLK